ncbi:MAG: hypothetical protein AAFU67_03600, partial [Bacteroidota bacterium]
AEAYRDLLIEELRANAQVFLNFTLGSTSSINGPAVTLIPRGTANLTWQYTTDTPLNIEVITVSNSGYLGVPGFTLITEIYNHELGFYDRRIPHNLPVISQSRPVTFDIQSDFDLSYELPDPQGIGGGVPVVKECFKNWTKYRVYYAETNSRPPISQPLTSNNEEYFVFYGARGFQSQFENFWQYWENSGRFQTSIVSPIVVTTNQPTWLYWLGRQEGRLLRLRVQHERRSGATITLTLGQFNERLGQLFCLSTGYRQLSTPDSSVDPVVRYNVFLADAQGDVVSETVTYEVSTECEDWERFYLVGNSLGGFDCWRGTGRMKIGSNSTTREGRRNVSAEDVREGIGEDFHYLRQHRVTYDGSIGHVSRHQIVRLQNLLVSTEVKMVDVNTQRFVPILVEPGSVELTKDGNDLDALQFRFKLAFEDHAIEDTPILI